MDEHSFEGFARVDEMWRVQCPLCEEWLPDSYPDHSDAVAAMRLHLEGEHGFPVRERD